MSNNDNTDEIEVGVRLDPATLDDYFREIALEARRSDEDIRQLIDKHGGSGGEVEVDYDRLADEVSERIDPGFGDIREKMEHHAESFEFPARRVGPDPIGQYHASSMWGIKFATGRSCHIHSATVDAKESGKFTATLGETDGRERFDEVDSTTISVDEGVQRVDLDLEVPSDGYYLLARKGDLPLRRGEWNGWDDHAVDNLRLRAGDKPGYPENGYWYYFFDMTMTASESHEFPD